MIERTTRNRPCKQCGKYYPVPVTAQEREGVRQGYCSRVCDEADVKPKAQGPRQSIKRTPSQTKRRPVSAASTAQRESKTACLVTGSTQVDQAHLWPRGMGGCDDALCTVSLCRPVHRALDDGTFDVLPYLVAHGRVAELQHALGHANGDLIALIERLTGCKVTLTPRTELLTLDDIERRAA